MTDDKIYSPPTIEDQPYPTEETEVAFSTDDKDTKDTYQVPKIKNLGLPTRKIAYELIGSAINTRSRKVLGEFTLAESGGFQIGKYVNGVTGDLRITPNGIVARDKAGIETFVLDATTGSAVFKGTIQAGTLIGGEVVVGDNRVIIDGANSRIVVYDDDGIPRILIGYQENGF